MGGGQWDFGKGGLKHLDVSDNKGSRMGCFEATNEGKESARVLGTTNQEPL